MSKYQLIHPSNSVDELGEMQFSTLASFNTAHIGVFWSEAGGPGPWEMHPNEDELLHVMEGEIEIEILPAEKIQAGDRVVVGAGSFLVVPRGLWHRHDMLSRTKELYLSPNETIHSSDEDPR